MSASRLDVVFAALSDPTRRAVVERLRLGPATMTELATPLAASLPALTKHLAVLQRAGLVATAKQGRRRYCTLTAQPLRDAAAWLAEYGAYWDERLDALTGYLKENPS
ncbi:helix-turn-helix transcriptional regulator [Jiangella sp. DSM 45060]|uniref:ArsR/SmtB family transcription factor n=1 Tax=Jiangella sp. DSM 45060 TaxID=1798224 RepID=UPI00087B2D37|nr:metalloregulator ArsR/SmtB family transcription factor [Jiangella sp. DSM 45060]SDS80977.1 DNA-binding transcriptional regulator, ArsR family [Jiangella sp. DSM 45060]